VMRVTRKVGFLSSDSIEGASRCVVPGQTKSFWDWGWW
jgi:hypothetical protein